MRGTLVISLDFELAWGHLDFADQGPIRRAARWVASEGADRLLGLLVERELPATWATVGALLRDGWPDGLELAEAPGAWESGVPAGAGASSAPEFYAPALGDRVQEAPGQELGFHGFTHLSFAEMDGARAAQELAACRAVAAERGVAGASWVFPRNHLGHLELLAEHGFRVYRDLDRRRVGRSARRLRLAEGLVGDWLARPPPLVRPEWRQGMVALPGSAALAFAVGKRRHIPDAWRVLRWRRGLQRAARSGQILHLWFHPIDLYPDVDRRLGVVERILDVAVALRDEGRLQVQAMGDFSSRSDGVAVAEADMPG